MKDLQITEIIMESSAERLVVNDKNGFKWFSCPNCGRKCKLEVGVKCKCGLILKSYTIQL